MADYSAHIKQARRNLAFFNVTHTEQKQYLDWQITAIYYVAVHLVNAFLSKEADLHFNSHERVKNAISPGGKMPQTRLDEDTYSSFIMLTNVSRRSRYLCQESQVDPHKCFLCDDRHFLKALICLNDVLKFVETKYSESFPVTHVSYRFRRATPNLKYFTFTQLPTVE